MPYLPVGGENHRVFPVWKGFECVRAAGESEWGWDDTATLPLPWILKLDLPPELLKQLLFPPFQLGVNCRERALGCGSSEIRGVTPALSPAVPSCCFGNLMDH